MTPTFKTETHFAHIYGYGLVALWVTVTAIVFGSQVITTWPNLFSAISTTVLTMFYTTIFALPVAALTTILIGGLVWLFLKETPLPNSLKASIAGGCAGGFTVLPFALADIGSGFGFLWFSGAVFILGIWCGWIGERLARRHIKLDNKAVIDSFD